MENKVIFIKFVPFWKNSGIYVSSMKFNSLNFIEQPFQEQDVILRQSSRRGRNKVGDAPWKGAVAKRLGIKTDGFRRNP